MASRDANPTKNIPPWHNISLGDNRKKYFDSVLDKFIINYLLPPNDSSPRNDEDWIMNYSLSLLKFYFIMVDFKDAVKEGNGKHISILHKQLLHDFKSVPGFNAYAIETLVSIIQTYVLLSEAESNQVTWAGTVNWLGGNGKNIEVDLLQENRNKDIKGMIKSMGANKTTQAITRASRAAGGVRLIVENFDYNVQLTKQSSTHTHRSSKDDEEIVLRDLRNLRPFQFSRGRKHKAFPKTEAGNFKTLNDKEFEVWLSRHKNNFLVSTPVEEDEDEEEEANGEEADENSN